MSALAETSGQGRGRRPLVRKTTWWRIAGFELVNLALFVVACAFWRYLGTGRWIDFSPASYVRDLRMPVGVVFFYPLAILEYPWMIVVAALVLATIFLVPVVGSLMFPVRYSVLFVGVILVVAHSPALAAVAMLGCLLAARTPLRSDTPFAASLLGLAPVAVYLAMLGFLGINTVTVTALQRWVLYAPLVLAMACALVGTACVLTVARILRFRPGAIWPVALLMIGGAVLVFCLKVRPSELAYALIARDVAQSPNLLQGRPLEPWRQTHAAGLAEGALLSRANDDLDAQRTGLTNRCRDFVDRYTKTRRAAEVLWIQAQAASLRLDQHAWSGQSADGKRMLKYVTTPPLPTSEDLHQRLRTEHAGTGQAALALLHLAELALQKGDVSGADEYLVAARQRLTAVLTAMSQRVPRGETAQIFRDRTEIPGQACYAQALQTANQWAWIIENNNLVTRTGGGNSHPTVDTEAAAVLKHLASLDPYRLDYADRLERLAHEAAGTALADEARAAYARAVLDSPEASQPPSAALSPRAKTALASLKSLADQRQPGSAYLQANYILGHLAMRRLGGLDTPETYFTIVANHPANPWRQRAIESIQMLAVP